MGHQRLAGRVSQHSFGGAALIRVDVPEVITTGIEYVDGLRCEVTSVIPAHTRSLGAASIYGINWCDEAAAVLAAHSIRHQPINPYGLASVLREMPESQRAKVLALAAPTSAVAMLADAEGLGRPGGTTTASSSSTTSTEGADDEPV
jgi:hypothetical protein